MADDERPEDSVAFDSNDTIDDGKQLTRDNRSIETKFLAAYYRKVGATPRLSREDEVRHAGELQEARRAFAALVLELPPDWLAAILDRASGDPSGGRRWPLRQLEICYNRMIQRASDDDDRHVKRITQEAIRQKRRIDRVRNTLILANLPFVVHVVRHFNSRTVPFMDLVQEGNIGLMEAVDRFEPDRGFRFTTYAIWWIRRSLSMAFAEKARFFRRPDHVRERLRTLGGASRELRERLGRKPTTREIARRMQLPLHKVIELLEIVKDPHPLESFGDPDETPGILHFVADPKAQSPLKRTLDRELRERLVAAMGALTPREKKVVRLRHGLGNRTRRTLKEVGRILKISRQRVQQIEHSALSKIRSRLEEQELGDDCDVH